MFDILRKFMYFVLILFFMIVDVLSLLSLFIAHDFTLIFIGVGTFIFSTLIIVLLYDSLKRA